jgi:hypothetical protein
LAKHPAVVAQQEQRRARSPYQYVGYVGEWAQGGIDEHAAALVLQQAFASKRVAQQQQRPSAKAAGPAEPASQQEQRRAGTPEYWAGASPSRSAAKYGPGQMVMVRRTSGAETMAVVDKHEAANGLYTLSLISCEGKVEGSKQAAEPDLREPGNELERRLVRQQQQRKAAAEVLQRSFQRRNSAPPLAAILESPRSAGQRQPLIFKHAANAIPGRQIHPGRPERVESLLQQQRRLANAAKANQAARGARTPFRPLL